MQFRSCGQNPSGMLLINNQWKAEKRPSMPNMRPQGHGHALCDSCEHIQVLTVDQSSGKSYIYFFKYFSDLFVLFFEVQVTLVHQVVGRNGAIIRRSTCSGLQGPFTRFQLKQNRWGKANRSARYTALSFSRRHPGSRVLTIPCPEISSLSRIQARTPSCEYLQVPTRPHCVARPSAPTDHS